MKGMVMGYLNSSPFEAFTLPIIMQTTFRMIRKITIGIPTIIKHKGVARTIYNKTEIWKLRAAFPF